MSAKQNKNNEPIVSVLCVTYNHQEYIEKALDSFFAQRLSGQIEIIIHDDASTDSTISVIAAYQERYPGIIKLLTEEENQFSKGSLAFMERMYMSAKGKYLAWCEGDDYWTDPQKLERQVQLMERNPDMTVCFHPVEVRQDGNHKKISSFPSRHSKSYFTLQNLVKSNYIQTNSVMYRRQPSYVGKVPKDIIPLDWYMHIMHLTQGTIGYIDRTMAAYRKHQTGIWWLTPRNQYDFWRKNAAPHMRMYAAVEKLLGEQTDMITTLRKTAAKTLDNIIAAAAYGKDASLLQEAMQLYPGLSAQALVNREQSRQKFDRERHKLNLRYIESERNNAELSSALAHNTNTRAQGPIGYNIGRVVKKMKPALRQTKRRTE